MSTSVAKVPQIMQMEALECGAACLAMVLAYYGRWVPLEQLREDCGVTRGGSKASNIVKAARSYGLDAKGMTYSTEALRKSGNFPCIVFWDFNHFVVVDGFRGNNVYLNDPARGQIKMTVDEFDRHFTGVALVFRKTDGFRPGGQKPDVIRYARNRLKGLGPAIAFVMLTSAITSVVAILNMSLGQVFMDRILTGEDPDWLVPLTALMLVLALIMGVVSVLNAVYLKRIQGKIAVVSSSRFMRHLLHLPIGFYSQRTVGDLQQRQSMNENIAFALIGRFAPVFINIIMLILYLIIMLNYSLLLTAVGVLCVVANAFLARYISKKRINISRVNMADSGKLYATTVSGIEMIETIKAAGAENGFFCRWAGYQAGVNEARANMTRINELLGAIPLLLTQLANIAVLVLGIWLIVERAFTPGALLAFTGFLAAFMAPVSQLIGMSQMVQETQTQMERIEDVMSYPVDVPEDSPEPARVASTSVEKLSGRVDVDAISFGYSPLEPPVIKDFSLHLEPGQWAALVGGSGSGKSTIGKLISGLYRPWEGEIRFDGVPRDRIPRPILCGSLSVVSQDIVTFDDSISDNVKLWDDSIDDYQVMRACKDAGIHDVIVSRDGGYSARILPGGRNFSGGQLQRLEIARALAQEPTILILDEATSALDAQTEMDVIKNIRQRGITCIVIAQRLSTIRDCDEIIVMDDDGVVERGTHEELLAAHGVYAELMGHD